MKKTCYCLLCIAVILGFLTGCATTSRENIPAGNLKIGWGKRSIAMQGPVPITGQFYLRVSRGVFTPMLTQALVLENGSDAVIFVSCDVVKIDSRILLDAQKLLKKELPEIPVEKIIINATHTHAGPATNLGEITYPNKMKITPGSEVRTFLTRQVVDAVKEAWQKRAPGAIAYGYGFATTGHSRRVVYLEDIGKKYQGTTGIAMNGFAKMYGDTNDPLFSHYEAGADPFINLLYTFDLAGKLTGAVINVPCPSQTNESAWALHASFWDNVRKKLQAKYGDIGVIAQSAAAGDLTPRQMHYLDAEIRRYKLKYADKIADYVKNPMPRYTWEGAPPVKVEPDSKEVIELMRAEDVANRITAAFDEVLGWAEKEKFSSPVLKHQVRKIKLEKRLFPKALVDQEKRSYDAIMKEKFVTEGTEFNMLRTNSVLNSRRNRLGGIVGRYKLQQKEPELETEIHVVRIGDIAFASNRFELFIDFMHRLQARSPFVQTFIVQLTASPENSGSYLATERARKNKGYSATPYCNQVSPKGGQQLVEETLKVLNELKK